MKKARIPTVGDLKALAERVLQLRDDAPFFSLEVYEALQPLRAALGRALPAIFDGCSEEARAEIDRQWRLERSMRARKYTGTGAVDTPDETWEQMRAASLAGESLRILAERFGVIHSAVVNRSVRDRFRGLPWKEPPVPSNVISFPRSPVSP